MNDSCTEKLVSFISHSLQRLSFNMLEKMFTKGFEDNPVFREFFKEQAHAKNLVILVGARGSGKTATLVYLKKLLLKENWEFSYYNGRELENDERVKKLEAELLPKIEESTKEGRKIVLAFDDVIEAVPIFTEFIKTGILKVLLEHEGIIKLVLALQSESVKGGVNIADWLNTAVASATGSEMLLGENPQTALRSAILRSYTERSFVKTFRGTSLVNLDAFWARYRDISKVPDLSNAILSILNFYVKNAGLENECASLCSELKNMSKGLAMLALARLPSLSRHPSKVIVELAEWGLNAMSILKILQKVIVDQVSKNVAKNLSELYDNLAETEVSNLAPNDVITAIVKASRTVQELEYNKSLSNIINEATPDMLGLEAQRESKRGRRGPVFTLIHVSRTDPATGKPVDYFVVFTYLTQDKRGYIRTASLNRLKEMVSLGIPKASEGRYLVVIIPSRKYDRHVYKVVPMQEIGRSVFVLSADGLSTKTATFINKYVSDELLRKAKDSGVPEDTSRDVLGRIAFSTLSLALRDLKAHPVLAELLLPESHEPGKSPEL